MSLAQIKGERKVHFKYYCGVGEVYFFSLTISVQYIQASLFVGFYSYMVKVIHSVLFLPLLFCNSNQIRFQTWLKDGC